MATGTIEIGGGGILDATGIGAVAGVPTQVIGGATVIHGTITGANTAKNIRQDALLNQNANPTSSGGASKTEPSLPPDPARKPKGVPEEVPSKGDPSHIRSIERQNESAELLAKNGYDIEHLPPKKGEKSPDYKIEGETFDCYSPSKKRALSIFTEIDGKVSGGQTKRIVLNLEDSPASIDELKEVIQTTPLKNLEEIIVIKDGKISHFFPFD